MGDCAIVIFHGKRQNEVSPAVYLHSHAGCVLRLLEIAMPRMRTGDPGYACARFVGCCHDAIPTPAGLGLFNLPGTASSVKERGTVEHYERLMQEARRFDWGGRGIFLVNVDRWQVEHEGSRLCEFGDIGDGFSLQEFTELASVQGIVQLPAHEAGE